MGVQLLPWCRQDASGVWKAEGAGGPAPKKTRTDGRAGAGGRAPASRARLLSRSGAQSSRGGQAGVATRRWARAPVRRSFVGYRGGWCRTCSPTTFCLRKNPQIGPLWTRRPEAQPRASTAAHWCPTTRRRRWPQVGGSETVRRAGREPPALVGHEARRGAWVPLPHVCSARAGSALGSGLEPWPACLAPSGVGSVLRFVWHRSVR